MDLKRREVSLKVGDEVLLSARIIRLLHPVTTKLLPKWSGPFTIIDYCGQHKAPPQDGTSQVVTHKLELPDNMRMHNVLHVSLQKP